MHNEKLESSNKRIRGVTHLGIVVNIVLSAIKMTVGLAAGSMALVADGIHSISDMATDLVVLLGVYFGSKKPDTQHQYGHGKIETFSAIGIALVLVAVGLGMIYKAAINIVGSEPAKPGMFVVVVALFSILAKELLYQVTKKVAVAVHSTALYANAWHHRSDALSSVVVVVGLVSVMFGFGYGDRIAAIVVGFMIVLVGARVIASNLQELIDIAVDESTISQIKQIIDSEEQIHQWHKLRTRTVGREVFLDLHILVDPDLSVAAGHAIADVLEKSLHEQVARPVNIMVHIEPDMPEFRK